MRLNGARGAPIILISSLYYMIFTIFKPLFFLNSSIALSPLNKKFRRLKILTSTHSLPPPKIKSVLFHLISITKIKNINLYFRRFLFFTTKRIFIQEIKLFTNNCFVLVKQLGFTIRVEAVWTINMYKVSYWTFSIY